MPTIHGALNSKRALIDVGLQPTLVATGSVAESGSFAQFNISPLKGLIDTGAQITCITRSAAKKIGLVPRGKRRLGNVHSIEYHTAYSFVLGVWYDVENGEVQNLTRGYFGFEPVMGCDFGDNPNFDVLIGMDIISQGDFSIKKDGRFEWVLD